MQSVRLHIAGDGVVWVLSRCAGCGDVDKHLASSAIAKPLPCKRCGRMMQMQGATIEAVEASPSPKVDDLRLPSGAQPDSSQAA